MDGLLRKFNSLLHRMRTGLHRVEARLPSPSRARPRVDRPIFLLGTQGGGFTLISRMLQRNPRVVTVWGGHRRGTGPDEMQNLLSLVLPEALKVEGSELVKTAGGQDSWLYASDQFLDLSRRRARDALPGERETLLRVIRSVLARFGCDRRICRFLDKSQSYTVKVAYLEELLRACQPHFELVTRNPYAVCRRAAAGVLNGQIDESRTRLCVAAQHWANSVECALEDASCVEQRFRVVRFKDVLRSPEKSIESLCAFLGLEFDSAMLPAAHHTPPRGGIWDEKWYPLRPRVNEKHLERLTEKEAELIRVRCGDLADHFGYTPEGP